MPAKDLDAAQKESIAQGQALEDLQDSLWRNKALQAALLQVRLFKDQKKARFECDSFRFEKGSLIHKNATHLLVYLWNYERHVEAYSVWELKNDTTWIELLALVANLSTQGVLFKDVNGDGYKDFVMEGYGQAGSGEKYFNEVYLYNPDEHRFDYIEGLELNPHFYGKNGIVTCYYNPAGVWSAEKFRLNWNKLELLEEIEVQMCGSLDNGNMCCARKIYRFRNGEKYLFKQDKICAFPAEYKSYAPLIKESE